MNSTELKPRYNKDKIEKLVLKAKILNICKEIQVAYERICYLISKTDRDHILYIPDDIGLIIESAQDARFITYMRRLYGKLKVVGGGRLLSTSKIFSGCTVDELDLSELDTHSVKDMGRMFYRCKAKLIDLSNFDTSNTKFMGEMFYGCKVESLDLSSFNTRKVVTMSRMFTDCNVKSINISSFITSSVINMDAMFYLCQAEGLDVKSFDTSNVIDMHDMFRSCKFKNLDLSSFNTHNVTNMSGMFENCNFELLDISSFDTGKVIYGLENKMLFDTRPIFLNATGAVKVTDESFMKFNSDTLKIEMV